MRFNASVLLGERIEYLGNKLGLDYGNIWQSLTFSYKDSSRHVVKQTWNMQDIYSSKYHQDLSRLISMAEKLGIIEAIKWGEKGNGYAFIGQKSFKEMKRGISKHYVMNKAKCEAVVSTLSHSFTITLSSSLSIQSLSSLSSLLSSSSLILNSLPIVHTFNAACNGKPISQYQQLMEQRNETLPDMEKCIFDGQRAWSQLCNLKKDTERVEYLTERFNGEYEEWDRTACIPNLIYSLNTGDFIDNDIDLHERLYGQSFKNKEDRDNFKTLNMLKWFGDARSIRGIIHAGHIAVDYNRSIKKSHLNVLNALCVITGADKHGSWKLFETQSLNYYKEMRQRAETLLGGTKKWKDNIFWHESNVHILFVKALTDMGYDVAQIYDGFYFKKGNKPSDNILNELYKKCVLEYRATLQ